MTYQRKTRDFWEIQGYWNGAWECENVETTRSDAKRSIKEYRANSPAMYRIVKKRERISCD